LQCDPQRLEQRCRFSFICIAGKGRYGRPVR
jgi:hypothetical protein